MESEGQQLENNGKCLFCKAPPSAASQQLAFYSIRSLLQYLQIMKVEIPVKSEADVGRAEPVQLIHVDLEGSTVKAALCEGCGDLVETLSEFNLGLERMMRSCLSSIQNKMKVGNENVGVEYPILEGTIMRQALNRLQMSQPTIISILSSPSEAIPAEPPEVVKIEVDEEDVERSAADDPSSVRIISEDNLMEGSTSSNQSSKEKRRKASKAPDNSKQVDVRGTPSKALGENGSLSDEPYQMNLRSRKRKSSGSSEKGQVNRKEPRVFLQDLPLLAELPQDKFEVDDEDSDGNQTGYIEEDVDAKSEDPSSSPIISEFDDPPQKGKRGNVSSAQKPYTSKRTLTNNVNQRENSDEEPEPISMTSAEPSTSIMETPIDSTSEEASLNLPTYPASSLFFYYESSKKYYMHPKPNFVPLVDLPGCCLKGDLFNIQTTEGLQKFLDKNAELPPEVNPFPANSVRIYLNENGLYKELKLEKGPNTVCRANRQRTPFFNRVLANMRKLFEKFGSHIRHLQISCQYLKVTGEPSFEKWFGDNLHFLKNLKEFEMSTACPTISWPRSCSCNSNLLVLPSDLELPLDYLGIASVCDEFISTAMLNRYGHQLRKLVMCDNTIEGLASLSQPLAQLQELTIFQISFASILDIRRCSFPNLSKLTFKECERGYNLQDFPPLFRIFPKLKYFEIELDEDADISQKVCKLGEDVPGLEYFVYPFLEDCNYDFLLKFPDLKQIRFHARVHWDYEIDADESSILSNINEKIAANKMYESNIWDKLPKLEKVCIDWEGDVVNFNRLEYNRLQQLYGERKMLGENANAK